MLMAVGDWEEEKRTFMGAGQWHKKSLDFLSLESGFWLHCANFQNRSTFFSNRIQTIIFTNTKNNLSKRNRKCPKCNRSKPTTLPCPSHATSHFIFQVKSKDRRLRSAMSFLPIARSSATLEFYRDVTKDEISDGRTKVVAMDLGKKSSKSG